MTPEHLRRIRNVFEAVLERNADTRPAFLEETCQGDSQLRREVENLLAAYARPAGLLDRAAVLAPDAGDMNLIAKGWTEHERIGGRWEIQRIIKSGGMGVLYVVYDPENPEILVAKTFREELFTHDPTIAERFRREADLLLNLGSHKNIAQLRWIGNIHGRLYVFVEYVSGGDLSSWIGTPRLTEDFAQILRLAIEFCDGMNYAASRGVKAHRDIKPSNCLITKDGTLKITDFGLAKLFAEPRSESAVRIIADRTNSLELTQAGHGAGTWAYMPPEQFDNFSEVDVRGDIYSFGVMLFQMITGNLPFVGRSRDDYERLHKNSLAPEVNSRHPELDALVNACLAKHLNERIGTFLDVRARLARLYEVETGLPAPEPATEQEPTKVTLTNRGVSLVAFGRFEEAITWYNRALELNPRDDSALENKALAVHRLGRSAEALEYYERIHEIGSPNAQTWSNEGGILQKLGRLPEALQCCEQALILKPLFADAWYNKGSVLQSLGGHLEEALASYTRAVELNPCHEQAWSNGGGVLVDLGRFREAVRWCDRALEIDPGLTAAWHNKAVALMNSGLVQVGLDCDAQAVKLNRRYGDAWGGLGYGYLLLGLPQKALPCFERAVEINPQDPKATFNKGSALERLQCWPKALECFEKARQLGVPEATAAIDLCRRAMALRPSAVVQSPTTSAGARRGILDILSGTRDILKRWFVS